METAVLVLDREEAGALRWFGEVCGEPEVRDVRTARTRFSRGIIEGTESTTQKASCT